MIPSGLYRDLFSQMMKLLDDSSTMAQKQEEADNAARENTSATKVELLRQGLPENRGTASRMSACSPYRAALMARISPR